MAKPRKQHQQASKKKLQVKQSQKQTKTEAVTAETKGVDSSVSTSKLSPTSKAAQQPVPAETAGFEQTVYGLNNLGNTCFYNSALQVLVSVPALRDFCTQPQTRPQLQKGPIGGALQELVQTVYGHRDAEQAHNPKAAKVSRREGTPQFSPSRLLAAVCRIASQFKGRLQQDSHELLRCLIEGLLAEERKAIHYLQGHNEHAVVPEAFTEALFGGELSSRVVCRECSHETVALEPFYDLSLPIPASLPALAEAVGNKKPKGKGPQNKGKASIEKPDDSPAAQEQQKLTTKQRKKAEKDERKQAQLARRKQRKRGSEATEEEEEVLQESSPSGAEGSPSSMAAAGTSCHPVVSPSSASSSTAATCAAPDGAASNAAQSPDAPAACGAGEAPSAPPCSAEAELSSAAVQPSAAALPEADTEQKLCGGVDANTPSTCSHVATPGPPSGSEEPSSSSQRSDQTSVLSASTLPRGESGTSTATGPGSLAVGSETNDAELASSADSPSRDNSVSPSQGEVPRTVSETYVSRNAESLSMLAAQQTSFCDGVLPAATHSGDSGLEQQGGVMGSKNSRASQDSMKLLSEQLRSASLAPDAKSGIDPAERASPDGHVDGLADAPWAAGLDRTDSTRSGEKQLPAVHMPPPGEEQIAETNPELSGGTGKSAPGKVPDSVRIEASALLDVLLQPSAVFRATADAHDFAHDVPKPGSTDGVIAVPVTVTTQQRAHLTAGSGLQPAQPASVGAPGSSSQEGHAMGTQQREDRGAEKQPKAAAPADDDVSGVVERDLPSVSAPAGEHGAELDHDSGVGPAPEDEDALYEDLEGLQKDPCGMHDVSEEEADGSGARQEARELADVGSSAQVDIETEQEGEEMGALGTLFEEDDSCGGGGGQMTEAGGWDSADQQQATEEATLQGCLAAFFAREVVTWECPAESAAATRRRADEQALASASLDGTPQPLKRRSVSFSEEAPRVKFIPGSAEQRGTNFVRALQGDRPFCRPLKHKGGSFLLNAYVDNVTKDKLHLGLQGQDDNDATLLPLRDVHAINSRIEFGSVPISPVEDPEDEEEQHRVRSQAQALLDCVADLVVHSGLQGAINLLAEGAQLQRVPSGTGSLSGASRDSPRSGSDGLTRMGSETWRIIGSLPAGFGEGAWEYPPPRDESQALHVRSPSTDVYVPGDSSVSGTRPTSPGLPASFWARFAASHEPIPESNREGSNDSDSATSSGERPMPLTPHNSLNEDAASASGGPRTAPYSAANNSATADQPGRTDAAGRGRKKAMPPELETRDSFSLNADVPQSPFSNDPEGRLLSNGWEPSWPVPELTRPRDSAEAYCRIFCGDKSRKSTRQFSFRNDAPVPDTASPFGSRASSHGYFADSEDSCSTGVSGSSPSAGSELGPSPAFGRRHSGGPSPFGDPHEGVSSESPFGRRHSDRAAFAAPEPGNLGGSGGLDRRDSQMGFPSLEELAAMDAAEMSSASTSLSSHFSGRSADPSPFAAPAVQQKGSGSSAEPSFGAHSNASAFADQTSKSTSPFADQVPENTSPSADQRPSSNGNVGERSAANKHTAAGSTARPNGVHTNGPVATANGGVPDLLDSAKERSDSGNTPATGVNKATGNAVFWTGSKTLGISFVDDGDAAAAALKGSADVANGMRLPGGAGSLDPAASGEPAPGSEPSKEPTDQSETGEQRASEQQKAEPTGAPLVAGTEGEHGDAPAAALHDAEQTADTEASTATNVQQGRPGVKGRSLQRSTSKSILRKSSAVSIQREAVKGYLIHRAPEVLTLHLKRFQQDMRGRLRKIRGSIPFPADLDITPFCDPKGKDAAGAHYMLVGVVEHQGSMSGGHYISYSARPPPLGDGQTPPGRLRAQQPTHSAPAQPHLDQDQAPEQKQQRQDSGCSSFDGEDLVPLTAIHKAGSAARSASSVGARTCSAPTAIAAAESPSASTSEQPPSQTPPQASSTKGSGGAHAKEVGEAPVKPVPRTIRRPDLDSASLQWFCASDSHVQRVGWDAVAACEAYILMYVRVR